MKTAESGAPGVTLDAPRIYAGGNDAYVADDPPERPHAPIHATVLTPNTVMDDLTASIAPVYTHNYRSLAHFNPDVPRRLPEMPTITVRCETLADPLSAAVTAMARPSDELSTNIFAPRRALLHGAVAKHADAYEWTRAPAAAAPLDGALPPPVVLDAPADDHVAAMPKPGLNALWLQLLRPVALIRAMVTASAAKLLPTMTALPVPFYANGTNLYFVIAFTFAKPASLQPNVMQPQSPLPYANAPEAKFYFAGNALVACAGCHLAWPPGPPVHVPQLPPPTPTPGRGQVSQLQPTVKPA